MMDPQQFLEGFENVKRTSDSTFSAQCPAHDDDRNSLSLTLKPDRWLVHCHAGCSAASICEGRRVLLGALFFSDRERGDGKIRLPTPRTVPARVSPAGRTNRPAALPPEHIINVWRQNITQVSDRLYAVKGWSLDTLKRLGVGWDGQRVVFPVYDADLTLVGLSRYLPGGDPKTYAVGSRELWPAPETSTVSDIWLVEGEPDVVTAAELGIVAVGLPGVGKWRDEWALRFRDKTVTVCLDADRQGREAGVRVANALHRVGVSVALGDVAPDRKDGTDLGDLLMYARRDGRMDALRDYLRGLVADAWRIEAAA